MRLLKKKLLAALEILENVKSRIERFMGMVWRTTTCYQHFLYALLGFLGRFRQICGNKVLSTSNKEFPVCILHCLWFFLEEFEEFTSGHCIVTVSGIYKIVGPPKTDFQNSGSDQQSIDCLMEVFP